MNKSINYNPLDGYDTVDFNNKRQVSARVNKMLKSKKAKRLMEQAKNGEITCEEYNREIGMFCVDYMMLVREGYDEHNK